jgi:hypothetical protein
MRQPDMSVGLWWSDFCSGGFCNSCLEIGSGGPSGLLDTSSRVFGSRPNLKLLEQGFGCLLADFGFSLVAGFTEQSTFIARRGCR